MIKSEVWHSINYLDHVEPLWWLRRGCSWAFWSIFRCFFQIGQIYVWWQVVKFLSLVSRVGCQSPLHLADIPLEHNTINTILAPVSALRSCTYGIEGLWVGDNLLGGRQLSMSPALTLRVPGPWDLQAFPGHFHREILWAFTLGGHATFLTYESRPLVTFLNCMHFLWNHPFWGTTLSDLRILSLLIGGQSSLSKDKDIGGLSDRHQG